MNQKSIFLAASLALIAFAIGLVLGFFISPTYRASIYQSNMSDFGPADRWVDLRYLEAMISHHREAILAAEQAAQNSTRPEIKNLASEILLNEPKLIAQLNEWRKGWYGVSRPVKDPATPNLGPADPNFDLRFLNYLIGHHADGLIMTKDIRVKSTRTEILNDAGAVENFLRDSREVLKSWREKWYAV